MAGSSEELAPQRYKAAGLDQSNHEAKEKQQHRDARNPETRSGQLEPFALQVILVIRHSGTRFG
jgi:hypothetical protein